jgi:hypothetical protein
MANPLSLSPKQVFSLHDEALELGELLVCDLHLLGASYLEEQIL